MNWGPGIPRYLKFFTSLLTQSFYMNKNSISTAQKFVTYVGTVPYLSQNIKSAKLNHTLSQSNVVNVTSPTGLLS